MLYFVIGLGGFIGSICRWLLTAGSATVWDGSSYSGTLLCNLLGCFILGWFYQFTVTKLALSSTIRLGVGVGLLGSFTTLSTFSMETVSLLQERLWLIAFLYALCSMCGGLLLAGLGFRVGNAGQRKQLKESEQG